MNCVIRASYVRAWQYNHAGTIAVRHHVVVLLLVGLAGCTKYQPVEWQGVGSWSEARAAANLRRERQEELQRSIINRRPIIDAPERESESRSIELRHEVRPGETLSELAMRYNVPMATLAHANDIKPPFRVHAGKVLKVPQPGRAAPPSEPAAGDKVRLRSMILALQLASLPNPPEVELDQETESTDVVGPNRNPPPMSAANMEAARQAALRQPPALSGDGFVWPARGKVVSRFGEQPNGMRNAGIDIAAAEGTPVLAAENGIVVYADSEIPGYGKMLLLRHAGGYTTAYAHNRSFLVRVGDVVERGQPIATVGSTGDVRSPRLHFELRSGKDPLDPLRHLKKERTEVASRR